MDKITILRAIGGIRLAKLWKADGSVAGYGDAKNYRVGEIEVSSIRILARCLLKLQKKPSSCVIRGKFIGDEAAQEIEPCEYPEHYRRTNDNFHDQPMHLVCIDIDKYVVLGDIDPVQNPVEAINQYINMVLPACFRDVTCCWQLSGSAGSPKYKGILKAHIWFWLSTPRTSAEMKQWAKATSNQIDDSLFQQVQIHYTANPVFEKGVTDPVPDRVGLAEGLTDEVDLTMSSNLIDPDTGEISKATESDSELIREIVSGENFHDALLRLSARYAHRKMNASDIEETIRGFMESVEVKDARWKQRYADVKRTVKGAVAKFSAPLRSWPTLASPFEKHIVPAFPLNALPEAVQQFANEKSAQSGFDSGGYAFSLLVASGCAVDHRIKMDVGAFKVPAYLWGALSGDSGAGKSPTLTAATQSARDIDSETIRQSRLNFANWIQQVEIAKTLKADVSVVKPQWKQRIAMDATTEALAALLADNPEGVNLFIDEMTEFIGRMDAYSGADGKDRGVYLRAYDGGQVTINRASKQALVVDNFSVGILTGIQPEKLAQLFKKSGGGSDGLYQRFLIYCLCPAGQVDYNAPLGELTEVNLLHIFETLNNWTESGTITNAVLDSEGRKLMQAYHNSIRQLASRTPAKRFAEHLDKYPGMLGRVCFALHCLECAAEGNYNDTVTAHTMRRAIEIMGVLYRHSESIYSVLDSESGDVQRLVVSAGEAILTKCWVGFMRGDLTRNATHWQASDAGMAEGAIDYLIELGWIADVTPAPVAGKRGRRSDGAFLVNPLVHEQFKDHATRVTQNRAERYQALKKIAGE